MAREWLADFRPGLAFAYSAVDRPSVALPWPLIPPRVTVMLNHGKRVAQLVLLENTEASLTSAGRDRRVNE